MFNTRPSRMWRNNRRKNKAEFYRRKARRSKTEKLIKRFLGIASAIESKITRRKSKVGK